MYRLAIVVLNYLNYEDTIECVDSILKMQYPICGIVIVENGSHNASLRILKKTYKDIEQIRIIKSRKNRGYARGNNIGIIYARKHLKAEYVLIVNNDTVMIDKNYVKGLLNKYEPGVGVIGSRILLKNNKEQPPMLCYLGVRDSIFRYVNRLSEKYGSNFDFPETEGKPAYILHGCTLLFTPDFFRRFQGFYKRTFLYCEEAVLYLMCQYKGLRQVYVPEVKIYHKEDQSSLMSFQNDKTVLNKYTVQSQKYVIWWAVKYRIHLFFKQRKRCV
ncbi:MAG: glycosyltransferase family 2 protein [Lachnospiraceae bacterium]|nr:glycosyltransferase family 2 protein [Lachnospiraceae bacterium]